MTKNANIRFEPANVAYVNVDLETHEMTGGVMDETTGTFYPVCGDTMPKIHIKFNNDYIEPVMIFGNPHSFNRVGSNGLDTMEIELEKNASLEADFLYIHASAYIGYETPANGIVITNLVNCTVDTQNDISSILITDPSIDASAEISTEAPK